jgi:hypothetical protein
VATVTVRIAGVDTMLHRDTIVFKQPATNRWLRAAPGLLDRYTCSHQGASIFVTSSHLVMM